MKSQLGRRRRRIAAAAAVVATTLGLVGCSSGSTSPGGGDGKFSVWIGADSADQTSIRLEAGEGEGRRV